MSKIDFQRKWMSEQEKKFVAEMKDSKWKLHQCEAAIAGWELALDRFYDAGHGDAYVCPERWDGSDEAMDMGIALADDDPKRYKNPEVAADDIFHGIVAARRALRDCPAEPGSEEQISIECAIVAIGGAD